MATDFKNVDLLMYNKVQKLMKKGMTMENNINYLLSEECLNEVVGGFRTLAEILESFQREVNVLKVTDRWKSFEKRWKIRVKFMDELRLKFAEDLRSRYSSSLYEGASYKSNKDIELHIKEIFDQLTNFEGDSIRLFQELLWCELRRDDNRKIDAKARFEAFKNEPAIQASFIIITAINEH